MWHGGGGVPHRPPRPWKAFNRDIALKRLLNVLSAAFWGSRPQDWLSPPSAELEKTEELMEKLLKDMLWVDEEFQLPWKPDALPRLLMNMR